MGVISSVHTTKPVTNKRRRVDVALLREAEDELGVELEHCTTDRMLADALTKRMVTTALRDAARGEIYLP